MPIRADNMMARYIRPKKLEPEDVELRWVDYRALTDSGYSRRCNASHDLIANNFTEQRFLLHIRFDKSLFEYVAATVVALCGKLP